MTLVRLARPRPLYHVYGINPCGMIALLIAVEATDYTDPITTDAFRHVDGSPVMLTEQLRCDQCGRGLANDNFLQALDYVKTPVPVDEFRGAMMLALQRHRGRAADRGA